METNPTTEKKTFIADAFKDRMISFGLAAITVSALLFFFADQLLPGTNGRDNFNLFFFNYAITLTYLVAVCITAKGIAG